MHAKLRIVRYHHFTLQDFHRRHTIENKNDPTQWRRRPSKHIGQLQVPHHTTAPSQIWPTEQAHMGGVRGESGWAATDVDPNGWGLDVTQHASSEYRLTAEILHKRELYTHVDHVFDLVPFWLKAISAAERGEEVRLGEFLEKMEEGGGWRSSNDVWELMGEPKWGQQSDSDKADVGWGIREEWAIAGASATAADISPMEAHGPVDWNGGEDAAQVGNHSCDIVDIVARQMAVSEQRRQQMHSFFMVRISSYMNFGHGLDRDPDANGTESQRNTKYCQVSPHTSQI